MPNLRKWSQTASGNASVAGGVSTIVWTEGQAPSSVNNSMREEMAQIRRVYRPDEWGWVEFSGTASIASQTVFKISGDQTSDATGGRRVRLTGGSATRYGSIVSSSFTAETTVTITVDSGSLSASMSIAAFSSAYDKNISTKNLSSLIVGGTTLHNQNSNVYTPQTQIQGTTESTSSMSLERWSADANCGDLVMAKSRGASIGTFGILSSGDDLGFIGFTGDDGAKFLNACAIMGEVDAAPALGEMPSRLVIRTRNTGDTNWTQRWVFDKVGAFKPFVDATYDIGTTTLGVNDQFFSSGSIINFNAGDVTITHAANQLTMAGGKLILTPDATLAGINIGSAALPSSPSDGDVSITSVSQYDRVNSQTGIVPHEQFMTLTSAYVMANQTGAQKAFNVGSGSAGAFNAKANVAYEFEGFISLSTMSASSGGFGFALAGTATTSTVWWGSQANKATLATAAAPQNTENTGTTLPVANTAIVTATTATVGWMRIKGIARVTGAGTLIPQVSLGVAAAATVGVNSWFRFRPMGADTVTTQGDIA